MAFQIPPPQPQYSRLSFPAPHVLLVTLARPRDLNCINGTGHEELHAIWEWMDDEPSIRVGVLTGEGRAFCAGADLKGTSLLSHALDRPLGCCMTWESKGAFSSRSPLDC